MKAFIFLAALLSSSAFAMGKAPLTYTPELSNNIDKALVEVVRALPGQAMGQPYYEAKNVIGTSEKGLPCMMSFLVSSQTTQVSLIEAKDLASFHENGVPFTRTNQFKWQALDTSYHLQRVNAFTYEPNRALHLDYQFRDVGGFLVHSHEGNGSVTVTFTNGQIDAVTVVDVGYAFPQISCHGPWTQFE